MPFARGPVLAYVGAGQYSTVGPTEYVGDTDTIHIPSDFGTDLASVPRLFWALLPPHGAYEKAAVLHDHLCVQLARCHRGGGAPQVNARDTDGLFRRVLREADTAARRLGDRKGRIGWVTRWVLWAGVRWGALFNPARRAGWWRDAPLVSAVSAGVLASALALIYGADRAVHALIDLLTR